ncbi:glucooligosaccharide oxidase [Coprinopsis marcescibilis]|uniref:Glucooligosaccharide oxidase n=1 Tax=Coprinopsis marcescibilis TaxID=230819 RepID=A0A5C3KH31_COPMA|nr:glucooligosaccharide oxidase [Coprinopsis marcescibilis]
MAFLAKLLISCSAVLFFGVTSNAFGFSSLRSDLKSLGFNVTISDDSGYSYVTVPFNLRFTPKPAAVAFPANASQVAEVVKVAMKYNYSVVSRSGGHSYTANCLGGGREGAIVVDLRNLNGVQIDSSSNRATIGPGVVLGDLAVALSRGKRALPHGTCPLVGVGGHSSYGGYGPTSRKWGLLMDTIQESEVVLANGTIVSASKSTNSDLFWALRGSAPSFGVVTSITVNTFPAPSSVTFFEYDWTLSTADATKALASFQSFAASNFSSSFSADLNLSPGSRAGQLSVTISGAHYEPPAAGPQSFNSTITPLLNLLPRPSTRNVTTGTYLDSVRFFEQWSWDKNDTFYAKSLLVPQDSPLSSGALEAFIKYISTDAFPASTTWWVQIGTFGGPNSYVQHTGQNETAFPYRKSLLLMQLYTSSPRQTPPFPNAGFSLLDGMVNTIVTNSPPNWPYGVYGNYLDDRLPNSQQTYYGSHLGRLQQLKRQYDPSNLFSFPMSISA